MEGDYNAEEVEQKWREKWVENDTYAYQGDETTSEEEVFSIDTPPPTVSGSLHFGHTYGNTLADFMARFKRMQGKKVFFPFGHDNNGIASERLTERELGIRHQDFSRREFQQKVREVCEEYQAEFEQNMQRFAFSMDWNNVYETIEPRVQRISQLSFIDLYEQDREYREKAPAIWCPECETAISQVEMEEADRHSSFNDIEFPLANEGSIMISTTRPELLPACVAIFVHPDDEENAHLAGGTAEVPLFGHEVPIMEDERVDPEEGSGIVMCCTFGDQTDIEWYKAHDLPLRVAIDESGVMTELAEDYEGMSTKEAREKIIEDLAEEGHLLESEDITHTVQVHERCDEDIEFLVTEQWYVKMLDRKQEYLDIGKELDWYPEKMFTRYRHWIEGLQWDWCISRQRDSGIPFPVWYCEECGEEVLADKQQLPVDPIEDEPPVKECGECGSTEFEPEEDVFDTWATSSLTPLINSEWGWNPEKEKYQLDREELYPMNLRYQGHDIISFWLFHTLVKCYEHTGEIPFDEVQINGMILDENRRKMSKSVGNVTTPDEVLEDFSVDASRYWTAGSAVGGDLALKTEEIKAGERLIQKIWNASKLVDQIAGENDPDVDEEELEEIDRWMLAKTDETIEKATSHMEEYEYSKARDAIRENFWHTFCDNYLEIAKQRSQENTDLAASHTLHRCLQKYLKMFAPFLPHVTEEIWRGMYSSQSIHRSEWPGTSEIKADLDAGDQAMDAISALRKYKSGNQMPMNAEIETARIHGDVHDFRQSIKQVMHVENLEITEEEPDVKTNIEEIKLNYSKAGPKFGDDIGEIETALEENEWNIESGHLHVAGHMLKPEMFEVIEERSYEGEGEMIEEGEVAVIIE